MLDDTCLLVIATLYGTNGASADRDTGHAAGRSHDVRDIASRDYASRSEECVNRCLQGSALSMHQHNPSSSASGLAVDIQPGSLAIACVKINSAEAETLNAIHVP